MSLPDLGMSLPVAGAFALAEAAPASSPTGFGVGDFLFLGGFVLIFYFLLWRPQAKRRKEHQDLMAGLSAGDEVVTTGGIVGEVRKVGDDFITIRVAPEIEFRVQKASVGATLPKGTIAQIDE